MSPQRSSETVIEFFRQRVEMTPSVLAFADVGEDTIRSMSWREAADAVDRIANRLERLGVQAGTRVAIFSSPCMQWQLAELALFSVGAVVVGIEPTSPEEIVRRMLRDANVEFAIVEPNRAPAFAKIVNLAPQSSWKGESACDEDWGCGAVFELGRPSVRPVHSEAHSKERAPRSADPDSSATVLFTSGTTGVPRAIEYSHRQLSVACSVLRDCLLSSGHIQRFLCWLPMASLFQRMTNYVAIAVGGAIYYVKHPSLLNVALRHAKPELLVGVPRFYEKIHKGIQNALQQLAPLPAALAQWGLRKGEQLAAYEKRGISAPPHVRFQRWLADLLVLRKIRSQLGGKVRFMLTGSAPVDPALLEFFRTVGLPLFEAYGVSENTIPIAINLPHASRPGSVGKILPGNEVRLADDGEILVRGEGVFRGYLTEESGAQIDSDGYYHTGDLGEFDEDGFLYLRGRKGASFKTSTGRRIHPEAIEAVYRRCPVVDHIVVVGEGRKCLIGLVALSKMVASEAERASDIDEADLLDRLREFDRALQPYERIQAVYILPEPLSVSSGTLTSSLKVRRNVLIEKYRRNIDELYRKLQSTPPAVHLPENGLPLSAPGMAVGQ